MRVDRWGTLTEFANAIREGREPECSGRENVATIAFMAAAAAPVILPQIARALFDEDLDSAEFAARWASVLET